MELRFYGAPREYVDAPQSPKSQPNSVGTRLQFETPQTRRSESRPGQGQQQLSVAESLVAAPAGDGTWTQRTWRAVGSAPPVGAAPPSPTSKSGSVTLGTHLESAAARDWQDGNAVLTDRSVPPAGAAPWIAGIGGPQGPAAGQLRGSQRSFSSDYSTAPAAGGDAPGQLSTGRPKQSPRRHQAGAQVWASSPRHMQAGHSPATQRGRLAPMSLGRRRIERRQGFRGSFGSFGRRVGVLWTPCLRMVRPGGPSKGG